MIIKGNPAGNAGWWTKHLTRDDTNERAELKEVRGLVAEDVRGALREMEAVASGSRSEGNFMYQANINPRDQERLTEEQWGQAIDTLEKNLGLEGHQRIVVEHEKEGRVHRHIVWNRVDVETMRVADMGGNYFTHQRTARELEERFDLARTQSLHGERRPNGRPERAPEMWEQDAKIDREKVRADLTEAWRSTDSGKAYQAAIEEKGYILANGERRAFVAVDADGKPHSLARRIEGATAAQVKHRLADIDRDSLPSVAEARAQQRARPGAEHYDRDAAAQAWDDRALAAGIEKGRAEERAESRAAFVAQKTAERQAKQPLSRIETEILREHRAAAAQGAPWTLGARLEQQGITIARVDAEGREKLEADRRAAFALDNRITHVPKLKDGELVAVNRFGDAHRLNPQKLDLKAIETDLTRGARTIPGLGAAKDRIEQDRAADQKERARVNAERTAERRKQLDGATARRTEAWEQRAAASHARAEANPQAARAAGKVGLEVVDAGGKVLGKLADVVAGMFGGAAKPAPVPDHVRQVERMREAQRAEAALYRIRDSMERGQMIRADDLHNLTDNHRENIRAKGDDYLRGLIDRMDDDRRRARDDGRTRDR